MKIFRYLVSLAIIFNMQASALIFSQDGDQILDGIGETELVARYIFRDDARDWSRGNSHAIIEGSRFSFVQDSLFGSVISLPGDAKSFISLPWKIIDGEESLSITCWISARPSKDRQVFFDFGSNADTHLEATWTGTGENDGFIARIRYMNSEYSAVSPVLQPGVWNHVAIVFDAVTRSIKTYINGILSGVTENVIIDLRSIFPAELKNNNKLYIGRSLSQDEHGLNARLHDLRVYRVPLTERQIEGIYNIALKRESPVSREKGKSDQGLPKFPPTTRRLYNEFLTEISDVDVETTIGILPKLPRLLKGFYRNGIKGPDVRVIWPSPTDNSTVLSAGMYTITGSVAGTEFHPKATVTVKDVKEPPTPGRVLENFSLDQVVLNPDIHGQNTKFIENRNKFITGLLNTNPDDFLYMFRDAFGQEQPEGAEPLGGWDSRQTKLRGHATGHYLSALAQAYLGTGYNPAIRADFAARMEYMVEILHDLALKSGQPKGEAGEYVQDPANVPPGPGKTGFDSDLSAQGIRNDYWNWGKGYISAYPPDQFIMLEQGATYGGSETQVWAPYYTLHKILAGLTDVYEATGNTKALEIVKGMGDWIYSRLGRLPKETLISMWSRYIAGEFGGMNEIMARLGRITGESRYIKTARLFDNIRLFYGDAEHTRGLAKNVDMIRGLHANQHIPQIVGALEIYRDTGEPDYFRVADNFWNMVANDYMYSIGGVAGARNPPNAECFTAQPSTLYENGFAAGGQNETCATYNMLKLSGSLFLFDQRAELMDYYELALYNHILASVDQYSPANTYHVPLRAGSVKQFGNPDMKGFSCCNGTALESNTKLQNSIYFRSVDNTDLYVNLFVPSTLKWPEKNVKITQETAFPREDRTRLIVSGNGRFNINVRVPRWATRGFFVRINNKEIKINAFPGNYIKLNRKWKEGDIIELRMPFSFYLEPVMDQQNIASLFWGPVLLAAEEQEPLKEWRKVTLKAEDISQSISGDPANLKFEIDGVTFKPFYETYERYSVYLDVTLE